jgi:dephospho-CoA kinase
MSGSARKNQPIRDRESLTSDAPLCDRHPRVKLYGLTGGIASGKSTVARTLRALGATVIDADQLARDVVAPGQPAYGEIRARWPEVIAPDGTLDRKKLGDIVFSDAASRAELNAMTHPRIAAESARLVQEAAERGEPLAFYEAALIVENNLDAGFHGLVVASVPENVQLERLKKRDGISDAPARARIAAQFPLGEKVRRATHVIDNSGSEEQTRKATEELYRQLLAEASTGT